MVLNNDDFKKLMESKNDVLNCVLETHYISFSKTLNTSDFVPVDVNLKICNNIYKYLRGDLRLVKVQRKKRYRKDYKLIVQQRKREQKVQRREKRLAKKVKKC